MTRQKGFRFERPKKIETVEDVVKMLEIEKAEYGDCIKTYEDPRRKPDKFNRIELAQLKLSVKAIEKAIDLLQKDIAVRVRWATGACPICETNLREKNQLTEEPFYCHRCGQLLKWSMQGVKDRSEIKWNHVKY